MAKIEEVWVVSMHTEYVRMCTQVDIANSGFALKKLQCSLVYTSKSLLYIWAKFNKLDTSKNINLQNNLLKTCKEILEQ